MLALENAEEVLQILDRYTKQKSKDIPPELDEYLNYVAKTGDTVYRWPTIQYLFREKLINVIKEFHDTTASIEDLPQCPNVDQFNYESMKSALLERLELFHAAPFTIQRLCELLTDPKKHYSRLDKFMRALEKNILVVSTVEPGRKPVDTEENGDESINGDALSDINIDMEIKKEILKMGDEANSASTDVVATACSSSTEATNNNGDSTGDAKANEALDENEEHIEIEKDVTKTSDIHKDSVASDEEELKVDDIDVEVKENELAVENAEEAEPSENIADKTEVLTENVANQSDALSEENALPKTEVEITNSDVDSVTPSAVKAVDEPAISDDATAETNLEESVKEDAEIAVENNDNNENNQNNAIIDEGNKTDENLEPQLENAASDNSKQELSQDGQPSDETKISAETTVLEKSAEKHSRQDDNDDNDDEDLEGRNAKKIKLDTNQSEEVTETVNKQVDEDTESTEVNKNDEELPASGLNEQSTPIKESDEHVINAETEGKKQADNATEEIVPADDKNIENDLKIAEKQADFDSVDGPEVIPTIPSDNSDEIISEGKAVETLPDSAVESAILDEAAELLPASSDPKVENQAVPETTATAANQESMAVEETDGNATESIATADVVDAENAMEAAPIKADDEQMEVDESNSVDPMDL